MPNVDQYLLNIPIEYSTYVFKKIRHSYKCKFIFDVELEFLDPSVTPSKIL